MSGLAEAIIRIYEKEQHDTPVTSRNQVPKSFASITREWLTDVVCGDVPGAEVVAFELAARDDGSSNRQRITLAYNEAGIAAGLPASIFCKATEELANRLILGASGAGQTEVDFYNWISHRVDIEIPPLVHAGYDPENFASFVMLENLEGRAEFIDERTHIDRDLAFDQVGLLARLHGRFHESPELGTKTIPFPTWPEWWRNMMAVSPDFARCCDEAFGECGDIMPERLYRRRAEIWPATHASVARHLELPHTLVHGDVHLKNWYITPDRRMGLSDWQNVTIGHWSRDFAYAMTTALTVEDRRAWEGDLLRRYLDGLEELTGTRTHEDDAWRNVREQMMTALAFWTITLKPAPGMADMQPRRTTREFLRRILTAIDDHDSLDSFG